MGFFCFKCNNFVPGDSKALSRHLRHAHSMSLVKEGKFVCGQGGCKQSFTKFFCFTRHLENFHSKQDDIVSNALPSFVDCEEDNSYVVIDDQNDISTNLNGTKTEHFLTKSELTNEAAKFIINLKGMPSMTETSINVAINGVRDLFRESLLSLKNEVTHVLTSNVPPVGGTLISEIEDRFKFFSDPFAELDTKTKQDKYFKNNLQMVEPIEIPLGFRLDNYWDNSEKKYKEKQVNNTFQYIPVKKVLQMIMRNPHVRDLLHHPALVPDALLRGYSDGQQYRSHRLFSTKPESLRIHLYYDEVEVVNPLGSKVKIHELGAFYYTIGNFPQHLLSALNNIQLLAVCYASDVKNIGFDKILEPFIAELAQLESDEGMDLGISGLAPVRGSLAIVSADGLAAHSLFGFLSPSANKLCRLCLASRQDIQTKFCLDDFELRSEIQHDQEVLMCPRDATLCRESAVRRSCILNESRYFHVTTNFVFDAMHDFLEGICPYEVKLLLKTFIFDKKLLTLETLQRRIRYFKYGFTERKNKPSDTIDGRILNNVQEHSLKQKAMQMWCLVRHLPLMIGDQVQRDDDHWNLLLLLLRIMDIVFSPTISEGQTYYLQDLIAEHHRLFKHLYPEMPMINKHHHLVHYPQCLRMSGPMVHLWCMRFEAKHNFFKRLSHIVCNFLNICKTMAWRHQLAQCSHWSNDGEWQVEKGNSVGPGVTEIVQNLFFSDVVVEHLKLQYCDEVFVANSVHFRGCHYKTGLFIVVTSSKNSANGCPEFGKILKFIVLDSSDIHIVHTKCESLYYDPHFHAFAVETNESVYGILDIKNIVDYRPLSSLTQYTTSLTKTRALTPQCVYLCPRSYV